MSTYKNPYPMPVQASCATAGTAVAVGWKIIFIKGDDGEDRPFFVRENDPHYPQFTFVLVDDAPPWTMEELSEEELRRFFI